MTVARILAAKGSDVLVVSPQDSISSAAQLMAQRRVGAVVVTSEGGTVAGILSERDLVRILAEKGAPCLELTVADVMTRSVITCGPEMLVDEVMQVMTSGKFRHVPVVVNATLRGIVSIGDVVKYRLAEIESEREALKEYIATA